MIITTARAAVSAPVSLDHVAAALRPGGTLIVVEGISEDFDDATARWCFGHQLRGPDEPRHLAGRPALPAGRNRLAWDAVRSQWLEHNGIHAAAIVRQALAARFVTTTESTGPYYFPDLADAPSR